ASTPKVINRLTSFWAIDLLPVGFLLFTGKYSLDTLDLAACTSLSSFGLTANLQYSFTAGHRSYSSINCPATASLSNSDKYFLRALLLIRGGGDAGMRL